MSRNNLSSATKSYLIFLKTISSIFFRLFAPLGLNMVELVIKISRKNVFCTLLKSRN